MYRISASGGTKVVAVHRGARDGYQVACALNEAGILQSLVTDLYWPADRKWAGAFGRALPASLFRKLLNRNAELLPGRAVRSCWASGALALACDVRGMPFRLRRSAMRFCDRQLGKQAAEVANTHDAALLSYSYYAHSAFSHFRRDRPRILFQLHPHPMSVRAILQRERELVPECARSLDKEWELALPEPDFQTLVEESSMPDYWIAASSFTKRTLIENGATAERIHVIPYGTDLDWFKPFGINEPLNRPLRLLFVGTLSQRKGLTYLVDALESLPAGSVELTICGRLVDDASMVRRARGRIRLRAFVTAEDLLHEFQSSDVFVFPSLAEGFGHVLLEAMACGLPVIATTCTAAPDLISDGCEGFVVEPHDVAGLVTCIEHFLKNPAQRAQMGLAARARAEEFTWPKFRQSIAEAVRGMATQGR
ncbi:MAG TPA: glycosyltransferase family 4 protein [Bryobacteraceae bacterium]|jgi:glycosyltransferase involved in cell wall biosynthesis